MNFPQWQKKIPVPDLTAVRTALLAEVPTLKDWRIFLSKGSGRPPPSPTLKLQTFFIWRIPALEGFEMNSLGTWFNIGTQTSVILYNMIPEKEIKTQTMNAFWSCMFESVF